MIKDLEEGPWAHMPSGRFGANAAWLAIGAIAHNLARWAARLGGITSKGGHIALATMRRRYIAVPGRLARSARRTTLNLAKDCPRSREKQKPSAAHASGVSLPTSGWLGAPSPAPAPRGFGPGKLRCGRRQASLWPPARWTTLS